MIISLSHKVKITFVALLFSLYGCPKDEALDTASTRSIQEKVEEATTEETTNEDNEEVVATTAASYNDTKITPAALAKIFGDELKKTKAGKAIVGGLSLTGGARIIVTEGSKFVENCDMSGETSELASEISTVKMSPNSPYNLTLCEPEEDSKEKMTLAKNIENSGDVITVTETLKADTGLTTITTTTVNLANSTKFKTTLLKDDSGEISKKTEEQNITPRDERLAETKSGSTVGKVSPSTLVSVVTIYSPASQPAVTSILKEGDKDSAFVVIDPKSNPIDTEYAVVGITKDGEVIDSNPSWNLPTLPGELPTAINTSTVLKADLSNAPAGLMVIARNEGGTATKDLTSKIAVGENPADASFSMVTISELSNALADDSESIQITEATDSNDIESLRSERLIIIDSIKGKIKERKTLSKTYGNTRSKLKAQKIVIKGYNKDIKSKNKQIKNLRKAKGKDNKSKIAALRSSITDIKKLRTKGKNTVKSLAKTLKSIRSDLKSTNSEIKGLKKNSKKIATNIKNLKKDKKAKSDKKGKKVKS